MGWVAREKQVTEGSSLGLLLFSGEAHARGWLPWRDRWERVGGRGVSAGTGAGCAGGRGMRRRPEADDQRGAGHGEMGPSGVGQGEVRPCQEDGTPRWDWCPCGERKRPGPTQSMVSRAEENPPPQVEATEPREMARPAL